MFRRSIAISLDFDYFVPEDLGLDLQHVESEFYLTMLWEMRGSELFKALRCSGEERTFWNTLAPLAQYYVGRVTVSDAHVYVLHDPRVVSADTLILFDQHHDCWPIEKDDRKRQCWYSHTWARAWLEGDTRRRLIWVYPDSNNPMDYRDSRKGLSRQLCCLPRRQFDPTAFSKNELCGIHICRSGCWTPPWTDTMFITFVKEYAQVVGSNRVLVNLQPNGPWDPMALRWEDPDAMITSIRQREAALRNLNRSQCVGGDPLVPLSTGV